MIKDFNLRFNEVHTSSAFFRPWNFTFEKYTWKVPTIWEGTWECNNIPIWNKNPQKSQKSQDVPVDRSVHCILFKILINENIMPNEENNIYQTQTSQNHTLLLISYSLHSQSFTSHFIAVFVCSARSIRQDHPYHHHCHQVSVMT